MNPPIQLTTIEQWDELLPILNINTIDRNNRNTILNLYRSYVRNRYVCPNCPSALWSALTDLKQFIEQNRERMEQLRMEQAQRDVEEFKSESVPPPQPAVITVISGSTSTTSTSTKGTKKSNKSNGKENLSR